MHGGAANAPRRFIPGAIIRRNRHTPKANGESPRNRDYKTSGTGVVETLSMTNQERKQARIARDKARKAERRRAALEQYGEFKSVMTMQNLLRSLQRRRKNTEWKGSVQSFIAHAPVKLKRIHDEVIHGNPKVNQRIKRLVIHERGKRRECHAIMIDSRVIQGVVCDCCITPLTARSLIYDNPASTKGKGVAHARRRIERHLQKQIRESGPDFYVLNYDLKSFFDSIPHSRCRKELRKMGMDAALEEITMGFIKMYQAQDISLLKDEVERERRRQILDSDEGIGATLGSQISQNMALVVPNDLDHMVKDRERVKRYIRYMDDGWASHQSKASLRRLLSKISAACKEAGLRLNEKKTHIVKASKGFMFLKVTYIVTDTGRIVKKIAKSGIVRMRRKLKKFRSLVNAGKMTLDDVRNSFMSWWGTAKSVAQTYRQRKRILNLYNSLFHQYKTGGMIA